MKRRQTYLPATSYALEALGAQIASARRELGWTASELADRLGVLPPVVSRIEHGAPGTAIATVLEAAVLCGVRLFGADPSDKRALASIADRERLRLALLPARTRRRAEEVSSDF